MLPRLIKVTCFIHGQRYSLQCPKVLKTKFNNLPFIVIFDVTVDWNLSTSRKSDISALTNTMPSFTSDANPDPGALKT